MPNSHTIFDIQAIYTPKKTIKWADDQGGSLAETKMIPNRKDIESAILEPSAKIRRLTTSSNTTSSNTTRTTTQARDIDPWTLVREKVADLDNTVTRMQKASESKYGLITQKRGAPAVTQEWVEQHRAKRTPAAPAPPPPPPPPPAPAPAPVALSPPPAALSPIEAITQLQLPLVCSVYKCECTGKLKHPAFTESWFCDNHAAAAYAGMLFHCAADFCTEVLPCSTPTHRHFRDVIRFCDMHSPLSWDKHQCDYHEFRFKAFGKSVCNQCVSEDRPPMHLIK